MADTGSILRDHEWHDFSSRQRMSPFPNYLSMEAVCNESPALFGDGYQFLVLSFERNDMKGFTDVSDYDRVAQHMLERLDAEPSLFARMETEIEARGTVFLNWVSGLSVETLTGLSDAELAALFTTYAQHYQGIYPRYFGIILAEKGLTGVLKAIIAERSLDEAAATDYFTTLTREPKAMVNLHEEVARLALASKIVANPAWRTLFSGPIETIEQRVSEQPALNQLIRSHQQHFYWITRDYEDPILSRADVIRRLTVDLAEQRYQALAEKRALINGHDAAVAAAESALKLAEEERQRFRQMREGMVIKEQRKRIVSESLYYFDVVLEEVARRTNVTVPLVRFLAVTEVLDLLERRLSNTQLEERFALSFWLMERDQPTRILVGAEAKPWYDRLYEFDDSISELKGLGISGGVATGKARLMLHPNEAETVAPGEIIVTMQAVPSFSSAIARAAAIIADGGTGLTSHTATLAREAKIPGVSGLKIATKVIKTGDTIEVNGNRGTVTILERA